MVLCALICNREEQQTQRLAAFGSFLLQNPKSGHIAFLSSHKTGDTAYLVEDSTLIAP